MGYKINIRNALNSGWNNILQDQYIEHDYTTTGIGTSATDNVELALKYLYDNTDKSSGLERLSDDGSNYGWRLIGKDPDNYGDIGKNATDISDSSSSSSVNGATGDYSFASGRNTIASGLYSHAEGYGTKTSTKSGQHVEGTFNIGIATDTIHETGIGTSDSDRKNAFEIYTDGTATLPEATTSEIESRGDDAIITKEFLDSYRYRETITTASSAWTITHNLGEKLVSVTVMDSSDSTLITPSSVTYDSTSQLSLTFSSPVSGEVLCIK